MKRISLKEVEKILEEKGNLIKVDLRFADLRGADLRDAELNLTDLRFADLRGAKLPETRTDGANFYFSVRD